MGAASGTTGTVDRDGHPDVAAAGYNASIGDSSGAIAVFHGNGDGTLQTPPQSFAVPGLGQQAALSNVGETRLTVADLNGDGVPDLVAGTDTGFSVLINTTPAPPRASTPDDRRWHDRRWHDRQRRDAWR